MPKRRSGAGEILAALTQPHPRVELYGKIIESAKLSSEAFMRQHPEWAGDERSQKAVEFFQLWTGELLDLIDDYNVTYLEADP